MTTNLTPVPDDKKENEQNENDSFLPDEDTEGTSSIGWFLRVKEDRQFRRKLIHTACLCWTFITYGWGAGMTGPVFPDIRRILDKDLETAVWFFSVGSIGFPIGSFVGGILYDKFNKTLLLVSCALGIGVGTIATPWCSNFPFMLAVRFVTLVFCGCLDTGVQTSLLEVWGAESAPYMQALHFSFSFGALVSPFVTDPFLAEIYCQPVHDELLLETNFTKLSGNETNDRDINNMSETLVGKTTMTTECVRHYGETRVHFAFLISGGLFVISAVCLFFFFVWSSRSVDQYVTGSTDGGAEQDKNGPGKLTMKVKIVFLSLLSFMFMMYTVSEDTVPSFLMTFGVDYMKWDQSKGSLATGVFWIAFAAGRFCGIFIVSLCSQLVLLSSSLSVLVGSLACLCIAAKLYIEPMVWTFIGVVGLFMSVVFPCIFSWTSENILKVSGKIVSLFVVSSSLGVVVSPILIGHLMEEYSPLWFVYFLLISLSLALFVFLLILFMKRVFKVGNIIQNEEKTSEEENK